MSDWVRLDITAFTKTTNREKILKILKGAKVRGELNSKSSFGFKWFALHLAFRFIGYKFAFSERSVSSTLWKMVLDLVFRWNAVRSRILTWTQIETRTAFQLWSSGRIMKRRLQTTQVWRPFFCRITKSDKNTLCLIAQRVTNIIFFPVSLCRIHKSDITVHMYRISKEENTLNAQGHGLLRRTTQPSPREDLSSKNYPPLFTWAFSQNSQISCHLIHAQSCKLLDYSACTFLIEPYQNQENKRLIFLSGIFISERW